MANKPLAIKLTLNTSEFRKKLNATKRALKNFWGNDVLESSTALTRKLVFLGGSLTALGGKAVMMAADFNMTKRSFEALTGSAERAETHLRALEKFAATTPFEFPQLIEASKRLQAYGFEAEKVIPMLTNIGDAAMALGLKADGMDRLTLAI